MVVLLSAASPGWAQKGPGRGFPNSGPWVSYYGAAGKMGPLEQVAQSFHIINIDADPSLENFSASHIATLKAGGANRVISYLNVGACERFRRYWKTVPGGFVSCSANKRAQRGAYAGYPEEVWMDLGDDEYQKLIVDHVAARLANVGVDGFFLDNLEIIEHRPTAENGPCDFRCRQGGLALVAKLRAAFPQHLLVMQNASGETTRLAMVNGVRFPDLLDGITREEAYNSPNDREAEQELVAWQRLNLMPGQRPFFIGTEDYVGSCRASTKAARLYRLSQSRGFSPYVSDASAGQHVICPWAFAPVEGPGR